MLVELIKSLKMSRFVERIAHAAIKDDGYAAADVDKC
jgi:hypothetical protein